MKSLLDTSVPVTTFYGDHESHDASIDCFFDTVKTRPVARFTALQKCTRRSQGCREKIREQLTIVTLTEEEFTSVLERSAAHGVVGGGIYDALLAHCALKAGADAIYTWNVKHFKRLGANIAARVSTP